MSNRRRFLGQTAAFGLVASLLPSFAAGQGSSCGGAHRVISGVAGSADRGQV